MTRHITLLIDANSFYLLPLIACKIFHLFVYYETKHGKKWLCFPCFVYILKVLSEHIPSSSAAGLASELKIKSYSTLKIPRSSTAGSFNNVQTFHVFGY